MMACTLNHRPLRLYLMSPVVLSLLLCACDNPAPGEGMNKPLAEKPQPEVVSAAEALNSADPTKVDPATLDRAEIEKVLPAGPGCSFAYTAASPPVLAVVTVPGEASAQGVVKIHGRLVKLSAQESGDLNALADGATFTADGIRLTVTLASEAESKSTAPVGHWPARLEFETNQGLLVGYRGWYTCQQPAEAS